MTNFSIPFSLTSTGQVSTTVNPNQIASDRMESLIGTYPGERVMLPDYGVDMPAYIFASDISAQQDLIALSVQKAAAQWEPTLVLNSVTPNVSQEDVGIVSIDIQFSLSNNPQLTPAQVATVEIGGAVVNG
jgi:uncharacterized protein